MNILNIKIKNYDMFETSPCPIAFYKFHLLCTRQHDFHMINPRNSNLPRMLAHYYTTLENEIDKEPENPQFTAVMQIFFRSTTPFKDKYSLQLYLSFVKNYVFDKYRKNEK